MKAPKIYGYSISGIYLVEPDPIGIKNVVTLEAALQRNGKTMWAIRSGPTCMNKHGKWEYEPFPSNRDDEFIERCRFETIEEAIDVWKTWRTP